MNKLVLALACFVVFDFAVGETNATKKVHTKAERLARRERRNLELYGGWVNDRRKQEGEIAVVNSQRAIDDTVIHSAITKFENNIHVAVKTANADSVNVENADKVFEGLKANLAVFIVDNKGLPGILLAPESRWAIVNVAKYAGTKQKEWAQIEILRALYFVLGSGVTPDKTAITAPITKTYQLAYIDPDITSFEENMNLMNCLRFYGITPFDRRLYRDACEEGWAPAPTNKYQQAVWDKVHAIPTKPLVIEPEKK